MNKDKEFREWVKEQDEIILNQQKNNPFISDYLKDGKRPYYGAIGGALSDIILIDKDGNTRRYIKHEMTGNTFNFPYEKINDYTQSYLDKIYVKGHEYKISECSTTIGTFVNIKDLTTGQEINNLDDI